MLCIALSVPDPTTRPWVGQSHSSIEADASEARVPISLLGNIFLNAWSCMQALLDPIVTCWSFRKLGNCCGGELEDEDASSSELHQTASLAASL